MKQSVNIGQLKQRTGPAQEEGFSEQVRELTDKEFSAQEASAFLLGETFIGVAHFNLLCSICPSYFSNAAFGLVSMFVQET